ncbi:sugar transferase, partial [bacterium D16-54]
TGYAQVYGKYNTSAYDKLKLDLMYIQNYSLMMDVGIIFKTVKVLFMKESTEGFSRELSDSVKGKASYEKI